MKLARRLIAYGTTLLVVVWLTGCADGDIDEKISKELAFVSAEFDLLDSKVVELAKHDRISLSQFERIQIEGHAFVERYNDAVQAYMYWKGLEKKDDLQTKYLAAKVSLLSRHLRQLANMVDRSENAPSTGDMPPMEQDQSI